MNTSYEQEIDLKNLMFYILNRWRPVFLIAVIFATLIGGYKLSEGIMKSQDKKYMANLLENYDSDSRSYQVKKEGYERKIDTLTQNIDYEKDYEKKSILFQLDPYNKWVANINIFIKLDEENNIINTVDPVDSLVKVYSAIIKSKSSLEETCKENNIEINYLRELLNIEADYNGNMISVSVTYKDEEGAQKILDSILKSVKASEDDVESNLRAHSVIYMNRETNMVADQKLAELQNERIEKLSAMKKSMVETQLELHNLKEPQKPNDLSFIGLIKSAIKYSIMGGTFGVFLVVLFLCLIYVINPKLYSADKFVSRFGIKIFGEYPKEEKNRKLSGVDNWLNKIEGKQIFSREAVLKRIIASISIYTEKDQTIFLTGTIALDLLKSIESELKGTFSNLTFVVGPDINRNPETLTKLPTIDVVILVEKYGVSKYKDIDNQIETIYSLDKKIIGCIIL
uniref:hypothetical protein n=1 Tax=Clostridium sp. 12(A) TaxID=1163671 RepID=UPI00046516DD|nr:hypothetical protein [Clostridium sp. 12(A)]